MNLLAAIVSAFGMSIWDIAENNGEITRTTFSVIWHCARTFGLA